MPHAEGGDDMNRRRPAGQGLRATGWMAHHMTPHDTTAHHSTPAMSAFPVSLQLDIPFQSRQQALVAEQALRPDPVLKPDQSRIEYSVCGSEDCGGVLRIDVQGVDDRVVRVTANNVLESLKTVVECLEEFEN